MHNVYTAVGGLHHGREAPLAHQGAQRVQGLGGRESVKREEEAKKRKRIISERISEAANKRISE